MFIALAAERAVGSSGIRCCAAQVFRFGVGEGIHAPTPFHLALVNQLGEALPVVFQRNVVRNIRAPLELLPKYHRDLRQICWHVRAERRLTLGGDLAVTRPSTPEAKSDAEWVRLKAGQSWIGRCGQMGQLEVGANTCTRLSSGSSSSLRAASRAPSRSPGRLRLIANQVVA